MNRRTAILWGIGAGQLLVAVIACAVIEGTAFDWIGLLCAAIVYGQFYLAGVWISFGRPSICWRLVTVATCLTILTWVEYVLLPDLPNAVLALAPGIAVTLTFLLLARAFNLRLHESAIETRPSSFGWFQFSLRSILKWTAVTAMLCSLAALVPPECSEELRMYQWDMVQSLLLIHVPFAGICVIELAIILAKRRPWLGLALFLPLSLAVGGLIGWTFGQMGYFLWLVVCLMLWFALSFLPLRLLGYRFGRCRTISSEVIDSDIRTECPFQDRSDLAD